MCIEKIYEASQALCQGNLPERDKTKMITVFAGLKGLRNKNREAQCAALSALQNPAIYNNAFVKIVVSTFKENPANQEVVQEAEKRLLQSR